MSILVHLPKFEGPLGLLLYLIRKEEMDIFDIDIHIITKQYFEFIKLMKELDLEVAGEFIATASTLIHIKSRMLLPQYDENGEVIEAEDPRKELVQKLLEYQKYQEAAKLLGDRPWVGRDIWTRGYREKLEMKEEEIVLEDNGLFSLISTYRKIVKTMKKKIHQVSAKTQSIASRILEIKERLLVGQRVIMNDLITAIEEKHRQVLITFLSVLELGKLGFVSISQLENYGDIYIEAKKPIETDAISRVEEYDNLHSQEKADELMAKAEAQRAADLEILQSEEAEPMAEAASDADILAAEEGDALGQVEFVLKDGFDFVEKEEAINPEEIATDEEILAAEQALEKPVEIGYDQGPEGDLNV